VNVKVEKLRLSDPDPDLSWLGEFTDTPEQKDWDAGKVVERTADDRYGRYARFGDYRYFVATQSAEDTGNPESVQQDYEQLESYNRLEWDEVGVKVRVTLTDDRGFSKVIESPGLWGVWYDGVDDDACEEAARDQWAEVTDEVFQYVSSFASEGAYDLAEWVDKR